MNKEISKIIAITLMLVLNYAGLSAVGTTLASFSDTETSDENEFHAGTLDISLDDISAYSSSLMYPGDATTTAISLSNIGSVNSQYTASTTLSGTDITACDYITMTVATTTAVYYTGLIKDFISATSTTVDATWNFTFTVASDAPLSVWGKTCSFIWTYTAWQDNLSDSSLGFTAIKEKLGTIKIGSAVVLNEFLPNPQGNYGNDSDDKPEGEWVELYNNSGVSQDLLGWYIKDESNTKILVNTTHTTDGTVIAPHSWLVVYMNGAILNNDHDNIRLYDSFGSLIDEVGYSGHNICHLEPTQGTENDENPYGNCPPEDDEVSPNKSYARIPDGIGEWVDPIPTPGTPNEIGNEVVGEEEIKNETVTTPEAIIPTTETIVDTMDATTEETIVSEDVSVVISNIETEPAIEPETIEEVVETVITADPNIEQETIEEAIVEAVVEAVPDDGLIWTDAVEETPAVVAEPEVLPVSEEVIE